MAEDRDNLKKRWSLALGLEDDQNPAELDAQEKKVHQLLDKLYSRGKRGSQGISSRWFTEVKTFFPTGVVHLLHQDAIDKFGIKKLLEQPAMMDEIEPDVNMVAAILSAKDALSEDAMENARRLVSKLAAKLEERLKFRMHDLLSGTVDRSKRIRNPRKSDIDWDLTIRHNLKHYQHDLKTIIPHTLFGRPRRQNALKRVIILVDQSASMFHSFVHAAILGSIMSKVRSLSTHLIAFDIRVLDLTPYLDDAVEVLFRTELGGGTNIQQAIAYAETLLEDDRETHMILISDLYEGSDDQQLLHRIRRLLDRDVTLVSMLALDDDGTPSYNRDMAGVLKRWEVPVFACSPDVFPVVMAAAINQEDLSRFSSL